MFGNILCIVLFAERENIQLAQLDKHNNLYQQQPQKSGKQDARRHINDKEEDAMISCLFVCLRRSFALVAQAEVQQNDLGSPQTPASWVQVILLPQLPE